MRQQDIDFAKRVLPLVQAIVDGKPIQHMERDIDGSYLNWIDCDGISWISLQDYRAKPEAVTRPWKNLEAPAVFLVKNKTNSTSPILICQRANDRFLVRGSEGQTTVSAAALLEGFHRIMETDGSYGICGVTEIPR